MTKNPFKVLCAIVLLGAAIAFRAEAIEYYSVSVLNSSFSPSTLTIAVDDYVTWVNEDGFDTHTVTSDTGAWPEAWLWEEGEFFYFQFTSPGTYTYYDRLDGFRGTIIVRNSANTPPSVNITSPSNGAVLRAPATFTITASASDTDGSVSSVQFFVGANSVGSDSSSPYSATVNNLAAGNYTLSAVATDNLGAKNTNSIAIVVNNPPSVTITNPAANAMFSAPANISINATASDTDGSLAQVQFFSGANLISTALVPPYAAALTNLGTGTYTLTARATDNRGMCTTSSVVNISVLSVGINTPRRNGGQFQLNATGLVIGKMAVLLSSTNLTSWTAISTNAVSSSTTTLVDTSCSNAPIRFYRVSLQ